MPSVLFVYTSADTTITNKPAGWYLPEAAHPYYVLAPHVSIDFASPKGGYPPLDQGSVESYKEDADSVKFLADEVVKEKLNNTKKLSDINVADYDAVFYIGGHGPMIDLAFDEVNAKLVSDFWNAGKIVSAVCHGPGALLLAVDKDGKSILDGRNLTAFSNAEESAFGTVEDMPFSLEDKLVSLGGKFTKANELYGAHVVVDGKLITGENPASGVPLAQAVLKALQN